LAVAACADFVPIFSMADTSMNQEKWRIGKTDESEKSAHQKKSAISHRRGTARR
jgi:hypothetical protein